jgi:hypothetical protein
VAAPSENERKERAFNNLLRMRRIKQLLPSNFDVEQVIADLEIELGETVSQRVAAKLLGIKLPELTKQINSKSIKTIDSSKGAALIEATQLIELVEGERAAAPRVDDDDSMTQTERDVRQISEMRALAFHRALARGLDKTKIGDALRIVAQMRVDGDLDDEQAADWERILDLPLDDVRSAMTEYSEAGNQRRQNSPFKKMGRRASDA